MSMYNLNSSVDTRRTIRLSLFVLVIVEIILLTEDDGWVVNGLGCVRLNGSWDDVIDSGSFALLKHFSCY